MTRARETGHRRANLAQILPDDQSPVHTSLPCSGDSGSVIDRDAAIGRGFGDPGKPTQPKLKIGQRKTK